MVSMKEFSIVLLLVLANNERRDQLDEDSVEKITTGVTTRTLLLRRTLELILNVSTQLDKCLRQTTERYD
jgi:hypothetical protein